MKFLDTIKNIFLYTEDYKTHSDAVIIACYFNPTNNPHRLFAFKKFYDTIKHLNHRIVECVIGDSLPELPKNDNISVIYTKDLLWHKESLLNNIAKTLPKKFKYVFWLDTDVIFTNKDWLIESVEELKDKMILQPFEYCVHLTENEFKPSFDYESLKRYVSVPEKRHPRLWRSFCANYVTTKYSGDTNYDKHGHVGFAWGARRELFDMIGLYDRALIGGADHIMAHAAAGQIGHSCIVKAYTDDIEDVNLWSEEFYQIVEGKIGYVKGDLFHIWHGDLEKRQYLKRIQDFTKTAKTINKKDKNGLYVVENDENQYVKDYFKHREDTGSTKNLPKVHVIPSKVTLKDVEKKRKEIRNQYPQEDDHFIESMLLGYYTNSAEIGGLLGGNLLGGMIGDALNTNEDTNNTIDTPSFDDGFGGGDFSGGGAGADWSNNDSGNFS